MSPVGEFNSVPYEIIGVPFECWIAPVGTTFPLVTEDPSALTPTPFSKIGASGKFNYGDQGVTVSHSETVTSFRGADTHVRKKWRTEEDVKIKFELADLTLEQYKLALNNNTVSDVPGGTANSVKVGLSKGPGIEQFAVCLRGPSPYMDGGIMQYEVPVASFESPSEVKLAKGQPAMLAIELTAYADPNAASDDERYGRIVAQTDAAS